MSREELAEIREAVGQMVVDNPILRNLVLQVGRLVSHLESETRTRDRTKEMLTHHERVLYGDPDDAAKMGLVAKVNTMWRWHSWVLCIASSGAGVVATILIQKILH